MFCVVGYSNHDSHETGVAAQRQTLYPSTSSLLSALQPPGSSHTNSDPLPLFMFSCDSDVYVPTLHVQGQDVQRYGSRLGGPATPVLLRRRELLPYGAGQRVQLRSGAERHRGVTPSKFPWSTSPPQCP